jgi:hypothetical protein
MPRFRKRKGGRGKNQMSEAQMTNLRVKGMAKRDKRWMNTLSSSPAFLLLWGVASAAFTVLSKAVLLLLARRAWTTRRYGISALLGIWALLSLLDLLWTVWTRVDPSALLGMSLQDFHWRKSLLTTPVGHAGFFALCWLAWLELRREKDAQVSGVKPELFP